jgi:hypothetical protein
MRRHWPLGRGIYGVSLLLTIVGYAVAVGFPALATVLVSIEPDTHVGTLVTYASWLLGGAVIPVLGAAALGFCEPGRLRLLLTTPLAEEGIYARLKPLDGIVVRALPYVAAGAVAVSRLREIRLGALVFFFFVAMLIRATQPLVMLFGLALRKLLVPFGFVLALTAGVAAVWGPLDSRPFPGTAWLVTARPPVWIWLVVASGLYVAGNLLRRWAGRAAPGFLRRDELLDYAFPLSVERKVSKRRILLDLLRPGSSRRRFFTLVQEGTGLYRPADWGVAALLALGTILLMAVTCSDTGGTSAHILTTGAALFVSVVWLGLRRAWLHRGMHSPQAAFILSPLRDYVLPVGHAEMACALAVVFSVAYFGVGFAAAAAVEAGFRVLSHGGTGTPAAQVIVASLRNLAVGWLLLVASALLVGSGRYPGERRPGVLDRGLEIATGLVPQAVTFLALMWYAAFAMTAAGPLRESGSAVWAFHFPEVIRMLCEFALLLALGFGAGGETFDIVSRIPDWRLTVAAWLLPLLLATYAFLHFRRRAAGRSYTAASLARQQQQMNTKTLQLGGRTAL